jgi:hypothetical protein
MSAKEAASHGAKPSIESFQDLEALSDSQKVEEHRNEARKAG